MIVRIILGALAGTVVLFVWSGITQFLPWGVPTAQTISAQSPGGLESFQTPDLITVAPGSLTTNEFDERFSGRVSTLTTDQTFSWIASRPVSYYNPGAYFLREVITQLVTAILIALVLSQVPQLGLTPRLVGAGLIAAAAGIATYGALMNWWGLPISYGAGAIINLVVGWLLATTVLSLWIIKPVG